MRKKRCIAMLLAGGQGSRLGILTKHMAKPAVPYGGKYRIIDFPLSNCANSGIDVVGVLTQYQPLELNAYIGSGGPWDLDLNNGGVFVLPPYVKGKSGEWYRGTANAIYQNMGFIEQYDPDYVLILSGDHIYRMDYNAMLKFHIEKGADATIAELEVPWEETHRFGILNTDENNRIVEFDEKPAHAKSNKASMGVYVFTWQKLFAYPFKGYWKDVGTVDSLLEANLDLLEDPMPIDPADKSWRIYSRNPGMPPEYTAPGAQVHNALVTEGCEVYGAVEHSVLFAGVKVEEGAKIEDAVVMPRVTVGRGSVVRRAIIAENAVIGAGCVIGAAEGGIAVVAQGAVLPAGTVVAPGEQYENRA